MLYDGTCRGRSRSACTRLIPTTQCCKWVAIDADYKHAMEDLLKLQYRLGQDREQPAFEMSRRGGHLWIFLETPLLARDCRIYIHEISQHSRASALPRRPRSAQRTRNIRSIIREPGTPAPGKVLRRPWTGIRWCRGRRWTLRDLRPRRRPAR